MVLWSLSRNLDTIRTSPSSAPRGFHVFAAMSGACSSLVARMRGLTSPLPNCGACWSFGSDSHDTYGSMDSHVRQLITEDCRQRQMPLWMQGMMLRYYDTHPKEMAMLVEAVKHRDSTLSDLAKAKSEGSGGERDRRNRDEQRVVGL